MQPVRKASVRRWLDWELPGNDEAEGAVGHLLHQRAVLLRRKAVHLELPLRAPHLRGAHALTRLTAFDWVECCPRTPTL